MPEDMRVVSGEQSNAKMTFITGDMVYINRGQDKGVRVGDRFSVVRKDKDMVPIAWFKWQDKLMKAMGTPYADVGQIKVVDVQPKVSVAQVSLSCDMMQRGDILLPYSERPVPPFKDPTAFDHFARPSGKPLAMVVTGSDFSQTLGIRSSFFANLGAAQGVKVGDYFRIFRYQGSKADTVPLIEKDEAYKVMGFGSAPEKYTWRDLPREIIGEGIVLNVSHNSSTVMITKGSLEVFAGDYVELE
jgi:ribosomal protein L24